MASSVKGFVAGAFGLYAIESAIRKTVDTAKELVHASQRLGIGVEQLQVLEQAAKDSGTELDTLAKSFEKIDVAREKALSGSAEGQKLMARFGQLGISPEDLKTKTAANLFMGPMRGAASSMSPEDLGPILRDIVGKSFGQLIPVLGTDFEALKSKMERFGMLMDASTAVKLERLGDELSLFSRILVTAAGPALVKFVEACAYGLLRLGQGLAGSSAALGAGTAKMGYRESAIATAKLSGAVLSDVLNRMFKGRTQEESDRFITKAASVAGFDVPAMLMESAKAEEPWAKVLSSLAELEARLEAQAANLNNPKAPTFDVPQVEGKAKNPKAATGWHASGDALLSVGNFLGSGSSAIESIAQQQVQLLQQIVDNTKPTTDGGGGGGGGDDFPI